MNPSANQPFADIPVSPGGHFAILLYAALYRLLDHLRRLGRTRGESLETTFERYPFLAGYFAELRQRMPEDISWERGLDWWRRESIAWAGQRRAHLPLNALEHRLGLDFRCRLALLLIGLVEEDSRFGTLFADLQGSMHRPTLELIGRILGEGGPGERDPWKLCQPLLAGGLVEAPNRQAPRSQWLLQVPAPVWDALKGQSESRPLEGCRHYPQTTLMTLEELIFPQDFLQQLQQVPALLAAGRIRVLVLRGDPGSEPLAVLGAVATALELGLLALEDPAGVETTGWRTVAALCTLYRCLPVLHYDPGPGETVRLPDLNSYKGPIGVILGQEGGLTGASLAGMLTLPLPFPTLALRSRHWQRALDGQTSTDLES
ncbi:MAG: hypothetical protein R3310_14275, partial [Candidatus Competibacteraceae bacterium]|nr:hypothetical protein [Candidatus Competibacteraceae bacterium]